jgi:hypothetical protein
MNSQRSHSNPLVVLSCAVSPQSICTSVVTRAREQAARSPVQGSERGACRAGAAHAVLAPACLAVLAFANLSSPCRPCCCYPPHSPCAGMVTQQIQASCCCTCQLVCLYCGEQPASQRLLCTDGESSLDSFPLIHALVCVPRRRGCVHERLAEVCGRSKEAGGKN